MNRRILLILLFVAGSAIYLVSAKAPFIYDDVDQILFNTKIHSLSSVLDIIFCGSRQIRVVTNISYALDWFLGHGSTLPFHLTNIAIHLFNTFLLWKLLDRIFLKDDDLFKTVDRTLLRDLTAFLFLTHPIQAEAVSYISGRTSLLQATGYFTALLLFGNGKRKILPITLVIIFSLLIKESCVLIPLLLLAYEITVNGKGWGEIRWREFLVYFSSSFIILPLYLVLKDPQSMYETTTGFHLYPVGSYLVWQARYYLFYLWIFVYPGAQSVVHNPPQVSLPVLIEGLLGLSLCVAVATYAWKKRISSPATSFLIILFFIALLPTNSILQMINPFAEYRLYIPNLLLCFALALIFQKFLRQFNKRRLRDAATTLFITALVYSSTIQQKVWADDLQLFSRAVKNYPDFYRTHLLLGGAYEERGNLTAAMEQYNTAMNLVRTTEAAKTYRPWILAARVLLKQGKYRESAEVLDSIKLEELRGAKPPLAYYQMYLLDLARLGDRVEFEKLKKIAINYYPNSTFPGL